ncbi:organic cation transporter protein [Manduca sexta]|uniref:organic cation transporter protein n=1 Tax=Manduca sexta TaxID=7130 RepID=UPI00188DFC12|nr:organic cation transporter protein [Manduca sexta]
MSGAGESDAPSKVDLDTILVEEIGQFGRFQLRTLCLTMIAVVFSAFHAEYVFTTARINTRCLIPECEDQSTAVYSPDWVLNAVPATTSGFDNCNRYSNRTTYVNTTDSCPANLFDTNTVISCRQYVYENQLTVVYDYDLACDEWRRTLIGFVRTFGTLAALPITGYISDRWGRRFALALNAFNTSWVGLARYWAGTYLGFTISQFVEAMLGGGVFSCTFILVQELVGPKYRTIAGAILTTGFAVGQVFMGFIAWGVPAWRPLTLVLYIPQLITIIYFWLVPESVRWLMSKGRYAESEAILKNVARINGKVLSDKSLEALRHTAEEEKKRQEAEKEIKKNEPWLIVLVFRHKRILLRCMVSPVWWVTTTLVYYGLTINAVNMSGNQYINYVAVAAAEIPGFWLAVLLIGRIGRKPVLIGGYWMCAACQIGYIFMPDGMYAVSLTVYVIGKIAIATVVTSIYMYTTEIYPTRYRHNLFAFSSMIGRIGSIVAPLTPAIGASTIEELPFILFAGFALVSGALVFLTPETMGTKLPDTMEEASAIGLEKKLASNTH